MRDDRFAEELRSFLTDRAVDPSPAARVRLAAVTTERPEMRWRLPAVALGVWAAVAVVAVAGTSLGTMITSPGPGATVVLPPGAYPAPGDGFHRPDTPWGHVIAATVMLAGLLLLIAFVRRPLLRAALVVALAAASLGVAGFATTDPVDWPDQTWATGEGYVDTLPAGDGINEWAAHYFAVGDGEPFQFGFEVRNAGPLPMTVLGTIEPQDPVSNYAIVGLGLSDDLGPLTGRRDIRSVRPFEPVVLQPGERQVIVVAGTGGRCAEPNLGPPDARAAVGLESVMLVYSVLGWERVERVRIQDELYIGVRVNCP